MTENPNTPDATPEDEEEKRRREMDDFYQGYWSIRQKILEFPAQGLRELDSYLFVSVYEFIEILREGPFLEEDPEKEAL